MISYREIPFTDPGSAFECAWEMRCQQDGTIQRIVPDGRAEMVVQLGEAPDEMVEGEWRRQPDSLIAGQITRPLFLRLSQKTVTRGLRFRPWALGQIVQDAAAIADGSCDIPATLGETAARLRRVGLEDQISPAVAESALSAAIQRAEAGMGNCTVEDVAEWGGLSCRQLERNFLRDVGVTPKMYLRILRFRSVFHSVDNELNADWAAIAADCGYADQSHLTKDFQRFAGCAPGQSLTPEAALALQFTVVGR